MRCDRHGLATLAIVLCLLLAACAQPPNKKLSEAAGGHADIPGLPHAGALYKKVKPGQTITLVSLHQINPDCSLRDFYEVQTVQPPQHGTLAVDHRNDYPNIPSSNARAACNKIKLPATVADYTAAADYIGDDFITLDIVTDSGSYRRIEIPISVSPSDLR